MQPAKPTWTVIELTFLIVNVTGTDSPGEKVALVVFESNSNGPNCRAFGFPVAVLLPPPQPVSNDESSIIAKQE